MDLIHIGPFELEISQNAILKMPDGNVYAITLPEAYILKKLHSHTGSILSRKELEKAGWGENNSTGINSLAVAISNLRKILKLGGIKIVNEPKRGYKILIDIEGNQVEGLGQKIEDKHIGYFGGYTVSVFFKMLSSIVMLAISLSIILYFYMSWVDVKCDNIFSNDVCYLHSEEHALGSIKYNIGSKIYFVSPKYYVEVKNDG
ncbi:winged helix-turn-helix domain-containing protein [Vibrio pelagius]|uniref:winged helix-turn-helix domain-containing protein n=1 Tax=Vibrio pelagius TaxID=28169 RepID=UPI0021C31F68|nr:winged helix-turn-helix domain-containing protein [Vibrio pelagius]